MTQQSGACKAQSAAVVTTTASICNAAGAAWLRSPMGHQVAHFVDQRPVPDRAQGRVAHSLRAEGTRPRVRLALRPARHRREPSHSVNRP